MSKRTLYDIEEDLRALDDLLDECGGDVSDPRVFEAVEKWRAELDKDFHEKIDGYVALMKEREVLAEQRKEEAKRMQLLARTDENKAKWLKTTLMAVLEGRGIKKLDTRRFRLSLGAAGGQRKLVIDTDVPPHWTIQPPPEPDKDRIRQVLEAGEALPFAHLEERGQVLRVK